MAVRMRHGQRQGNAQGRYEHLVFSIQRPEKSKPEVVDANIYLLLCPGEDDGGEFLAGFFIIRKLVAAATQGEDN